MHLWANANIKKLNSLLSVFGFPWGTFLFCAKCSIWCNLETSIIVVILKLWEKTLWVSVTLEDRYFANIGCNYVVCLLYFLSDWFLMIRVTSKESSIQEHRKELCKQETRRNDSKSLFDPFGAQNCTEHSLPESISDFAKPCQLNFCAEYVQHSKCSMEIFLVADRKYFG